MDEALTELGEYIAAGLSQEVRETEVVNGELIVHVQRLSIVKALTFLRDDANCRFRILLDICGVDYPGRAERFEVVYNLLSVSQNQRVRVKLSKPLMANGFVSQIAQPLCIWRALTHRQFLDRTVQTIVVEQGNSFSLRTRPCCRLGRGVLGIFNAQLTKKMRACVAVGADH